MRDPSGGNGRAQSLALCGIKDLPSVLPINHNCDLITEILTNRQFKIPRACWVTSIMSFNKHR